jgi:hypothetical protein
LPLFPPPRGCRKFPPLRVLFSSACTRSPGVGLSNSGWVRNPFSNHCFILNPFFLQIIYIYTVGFYVCNQFSLHITYSLIRIHFCSTNTSASKSNEPLS